MSSSLPTDSAARKAIPICTGVFDYFPDALAAVARVSLTGNEKHNPGEPLHWAREKSTDHPNCIGRHLIERGTMDADGHRHSAHLAWRSLALLQTEIEEERAKARAGAFKDSVTLRGSTIDPELPLSQQPPNALEACGCPPCLEALNELRRARRSGDYSG